ncbi:MAG TPA: 50S ribosomal protein L2, partial [Candidatus Dojkabacteria bacterium]
TPTRRHTIVLDNSMLSKKSPEKRLIAPMKSKAGRNFRGKITVRHRGGGVKRKYRVIDFKRDKYEVVGKVAAFEYDPNRTANIALIQYKDGEKRYIVAPEGLEIGQEIISSRKQVSVKPGNSTNLKNIPFGTIVHNVEMVPGKGAQMARSAGSGVQIMGGDKQYIQLKMPSGEIRLVREDCMATIGTIGNADQVNVKLGKAGRKRKKGIRPSVRGVAMSSKHPHGGGQGKSGRHGPGGPAKDRWGNRVGKRTRKNKRTNKYIVQRPQTKSRKAKSYKTII